MVVAVGFSTLLLVSLAAVSAGFMAGGSSLCSRCFFELLFLSWFWRFPVSFDWMLVLRGSAVCRPFIVQVFSSLLLIIFTSPISLLLVIFTSPISLLLDIFSGLVVGFCKITLFLFNEIQSTKKKKVLRWNIFT